MFIIPDSQQSKNKCVRVPSLSKPMHSNQSKYRTISLDNFDMPTKLEKKMINDLVDPVLNCKLIYSNLS